MINVIEFFVFSNLFTCFIKLLFVLHTAVPMLVILSILIFNYCIHTQDNSKTKTTQTNPSTKDQNSYC